MAKRTSAQNAATFQRRETRARAAGFSSYREQRRMRAEALKMGAPKGNTKKAVEARDKIGKEIRDYRQGDWNREKIDQVFGDYADDYDFEIDYESAEWFAFLDELSPKRGK